MKRLTKKQKIDLKTDGYLFLKEFKPNIPTFDVASNIGKVQKIDNIPAVQQLRPKDKSESTSNVYSGNYGLGEFPLHSDLAHWAVPPRYLMLRCVVPSSDVCTFLVSAQKTIEQTEKIVVERALFKPRKKISGQLNLLRFYEIESGFDKYRWDNLFITPDNREAKIIDRHMTNYTEANAELRCYYKVPGDTVIVDNWRMFHGRSAVLETSKDRLIERIYMSEILN